MFQLFKDRSSDEVPASIHFLVMPEHVHSFIYNIITFGKVWAIDSYLKFKISSFSLTFQNKVCRRILSNGLIIYCAVYYHIHRYIKISFGRIFLHYTYILKRMSLWKIYRKNGILLEDPLTELYPSERSTESRISF